MGLFFMINKHTVCNIECCALSYLFYTKMDDDLSSRFTPNTTNTPTYSVLFMVGVVTIVSMCGLVFYMYQLHTIKKERSSLVVEMEDYTRIPDPSTISSVNISSANKKRDISSYNNVYTTSYTQDHSLDDLL